ncbi:hypothetical protein FACS1894202_08460 [Clostridia bacterium]|nr:hypothetical protein FACS1894202_08460 [Clostridia bacterium]
MIYYILCFVLLSVGLVFAAYALLKIPPSGAGKRLKASVRGKETIGGTLQKVFIAPLVKPIAALIPMKRGRESELARNLRRVGMEIPPKEYYARALIVAALSLLLSVVIAVMGLPQAASATAILSVLIFFHFTTMHKDALKSKQLKIELGLPGFIRSILHQLPDTRHSGEVKVDLIRIFEDYLKVANEVFYYDVAYLITEMKSKDNRTALRNFDARIGLSEVTFLTRALIGLDRGEDQSDALAHLARDVDLKARENIRKVLAKRPGK